MQILTKNANTSTLIRFKFCDRLFFRNVTSKQNSVQLHFEHFTPAYEKFLIRSPSQINAIDPPLNYNKFKFNQVIACRSMKICQVEILP